MRFRWPRFLPKFPAVLLAPALMAALAFSGAEKQPGWPIWDWKFPLKFTIAYEYSVKAWAIVGVGGFLVDTSLALAAAWALAMAVDRLVFPLLQRRRRQGRPTPPEPS